MNAQFVASVAAVVRKALDAQGARHVAEMQTLRSEMDALRTELRAIPAGPAGPAGPRGERGEAGAQGERGEAGARGADGTHGKDGFHGKDGRDGIASIDELRAEVSKAIEAIGIGALIEKAAHDAVEELPTLKYCGVWREGEYVPGNTCTWAGSLWHCDSKTTDKPGEGSKDWTLAVKKGRDAKAAVQV